MTGITDDRRLVLNRRRDQLETDIKSALNFLHGTDLVVRLLMAADSYASKCCEATAPHIAEADAGLAEARITEVQQLTLKPGDGLAVKVNRMPTQADADRIRSIVEERFPGVKVLILAPGMDLQVIERHR